MQVDGVNPGHAYGWQKVHENQDTTEQNTEPQAENNTIAEPQTDDFDGERGVIRLLQEGHFKGVSDVRLRINFFDEISGIEAQQLQTVTAENAATAISSVGGVVEAFLADNELTEEQAAALSDAQLAFEQAVSDAEDKTQALNNAFAEFLAALQSLFTPPAEPEEEPQPPDAETQPAGEEPSGQTIEEPPTEPPAEPPAPQPEETTEEPPPTDTGPDWLALIESLQAAFDAAMQQLTSAVNSTSALPPLSEPTGNGVAYDKFLAIYNQMRGIEPAGQDLDQTETPEPET